MRRRVGAEDGSSGPRIPSTRDGVPLPPGPSDPVGTEPVAAPVTMPQLAGSVASAGSMGSRSLLRLPSYLPLSFVSIPC